jgi:hypothetical protein
MKRSAITGLVLALVLCASATAQATEWMFCGDQQGTVELGFLLGSVDAFMPAGATMRHDTRHWTTSEAYGEGAIMTVGQGFSDKDVLIVDLYDEAVSAAIAKLRIWKSEEGDTIVAAGTLRIPGQGAWAVACDVT